MNGKKRWFNYRPIAVSFAFLVFGSIFSFYVNKYIAISISIILLFFAISILVAVIRKQPKYAIVPVVAFILGCVGYQLSIKQATNYIDYQPKMIKARVYSVSKANDDYIKVKADSCVFDGNEISDNINILIYDYYGIYDNIETGSVLEFEPLNFFNADIFYYGTPDSRAVSQRLKYTATVKYENIRFGKQEKKLNERLREKIKENLRFGLSNENVEIVYSSLFGNKEMLSDLQYESFKLAGVAHLLAVSGLHVGIIAGILAFVCKKLRIKRVISLIITTVFLLFYCYLCDYAVSVVRASIMTFVMLFGKVLGRKYDNYNAISLAGIVIFFANPLCVFDVAFLLSFACILGIAMLQLPVYESLEKFPMPDGLRTSLSMSISTTVAIMFIMIVYFKQLNIISLVANIIIIPVFSLGFSVAFVLAMLSLVCKYFGYLLYATNFIFDFVSLMATSLGNLWFANFSTASQGYPVMLLYFVMLVLMGGLCIAKPRYKMILTLPIAMLLFACII